MSGITIPLAEIGGGRAASPRVVEPETGDAIARFGQRIAQIGDAMETDRLDREMIAARSGMNRDLGQLRQDLAAGGDPDGIDAGWAEQSKSLREQYIGQADPRNQARLGLAFDELADSNALALGARSIDLRQSQRRALLGDQVQAFVAGAAGADASGREASYGQLADSVAEAVHSGSLTPEAAATLLRSAKDDGERAALTGRLAADPDGALTDLEKGTYAGLDPLYIEGAKVQAKAAISTREAAAAKAAQQAADKAQREIGDRLDVIIGNAREGRVTTEEAALLADPEVKANPKFAEAQAAVDLRNAMPQFAMLSPRDQAAMIAAEKAKTIGTRYDAKTLEQMQAVADGAQRKIGDRLDAVIENARAGRTSTDEAALLASPDVQTNPKFAEAQAAVGLRNAMPQFAMLAPAAQTDLIAAEQAKTVGKPYEARVLDQMQTAAAANAAAWEKDPIARAQAILPAKPEALPDPASASPADLATALAARRGYSADLQKQGYTPDGPVFFSATERATLAAAAGTSADPARRTALAGAFVTAFGRDAARAMREIGGDPVFAHMGGLVAAGGNPALAAEAFHGEQAAEAKVVQPLKPELQRAAVQDTLGDLVDQPDEQARIVQVADALYAARARGVDPEDGQEIYTRALQDALGAGMKGRNQDQSGGVQTIRRTPVILPIGVTAAEVENGLSVAAARLQQDERFRPFRSGEKVDNADGSYSTERSVTAQASDGSWVNVPSLWMVGGKPTDLIGEGDDGLLNRAEQYERTTGFRFPRFKSLDEAEKAAETRSAEGGAGAGGQVDPMSPWRDASASGGAPLYAGQPLTADVVGDLKMRAVGNGVYRLYIERRGQRFDVTDDKSGRAYLLRLDRFLKEAK